MPFPIWLLFSWLLSCSYNMIYFIRHDPNSMRFYSFDIVHSCKAVPCQHPAHVSSVGNFVSGPLVSGIDQTSLRQVGVIRYQSCLLWYFLVQSLEIVRKPPECQSKSAPERSSKVSIWRVFSSCYFCFFRWVDGLSFGRYSARLEPSISCHCLEPERRICYRFIASSGL